MRQRWSLHLQGFTSESLKILSGEVTETECEVQDVYYSVHVKRDAPEDHPRSMRVDYRVGFSGTRAGSSRWSTSRR